MTTIRTRLKVPADGNVIVPVGTSEAGLEVEVTISSVRPPITQAQWEAFIERTAGSIDDSTFVRPEQPPLDPAPNFD